MALEIIEELKQTASETGFKVDSFAEVSQYPLLGFSRLGSASQSPVVLLSTGIHGDEIAPVEAILKLLKLDLLDKRFSWIVAPLLNPSGFERGTRENQQNQDLNRDFRNTTSNEIASYKNWLNDQPTPDLSLNLHEDWEAKGFYLYMIGNSKHIPIGREILNTVSSIIAIDQSSEIDGHIAGNGLIFPRDQFDPKDLEEWPEAVYLAEKHPHLHFTFETPSALPLNDRVEAQVSAVLSAVSHFGASDK